MSSEPFWVGDRFRIRTLTACFPAGSTRLLILPAVSSEPSSGSGNIRVSWSSFGPLFISADPPSRVQPRTDLHPKGQRSPRFGAALLQLHGAARGPPGRLHLHPDQPAALPAGPGGEDPNRVGSLRREALFRTGRRSDPSEAELRSIRTQNQNLLL